MHAIALQSLFISPATCN